MTSFCIRILYERGFLQIVQTLLYALQYGDAVLLDFGHNVSDTSLVGIAEDGIIAHHATLSDFAVILDVEHRETAGILVEVVHGTVLAAHYPVDIHLEEELSDADITKAAARIGAKTSGSQEGRLRVDLTKEEFKKQQAVLKELQERDVQSLTPIEALLFINQLQDKLK